MKVATQNNRKSITGTEDQPLIYLVDDDPVFLTLIQSDLGAMTKVKTRAFSSGESCLKQMHKNPSMVVLDYELAGDNSNMMNGVEVLRKIKETNPETEVVMLSGCDDVTVAVASIKFGAYDYVVKNESALINIKNKAKNIFRKLQILKRLAEEKMYKYYAAGLILLIGVFIFTLHWLVSP
ncbi:MAG: response regulator [Flavobacteriales bacterium]|nr:response regulator [Flavobacteriales bacterium]